MMRQDPPAGINQFEIDDDDSSFQLGSSRSGMDTAPSFQNSSPMQNNNINNTNDPNLPWYKRLASCFQLSTFQRHFNVDTIDVQNRVKSAIIHANTPDHFREQVLTSNGTKEADLYGPVWISMTLMFLFAVTGNTSKYLKNDAQDVEYDISHLSKAFSILMVYTFCVPSALFIMMQCVNVNVGLVEIIALYGYSLVPYLPVTILCLIPSSWLEVILLLAASMLSLLLVARNLTGPIMKSNSRWGASMCMAVVCVHFVFFLIFKIVFYSHHSHASGNNHNGSNNAGKTDDDIDDDGQLNRIFL